ncbi:unnamed protein product [Fraxinus pennsylvanica]|uniref:DUF4283 domain-containing protein n=1 Tax=Fraxinus pennsylvanica TaxID=56036 RepID=A0AAD1Z0P1_9LAMI|nr:unnamed protein product [Fraxinus pennsylvanica]
MAGPKQVVAMKILVDIDGDMGFRFTEMEEKKLAEEFRFGLVLKFLTVRPNIDTIRLTINKTWGLREMPVVSFMDSKHVLFQLRNEIDYIHTWAREGRTMAGGNFRLFKWTRDFDLSSESPLAPQWIFLPKLPLHLYGMDCLKILASRFGRYLGTDQATLTRTRATGTMICVEVDLRDTPILGFPIAFPNRNI